MSNPKQPSPNDFFDEDGETMMAPGIGHGLPPAPSQPQNNRQAPAPVLTPGSGMGALQPVTAANSLPIEPDVEGQATVMHDGLLDSLGKLGKLVVMKGVKEGEEFPLLDPIVSFGREKDNTISYPDLAVSRHHFKVHKRGDDHFLEDLGRNITMINGKKITGEVKLKNGDHIQVGKSLLRFEIAGEPLPTAGGSSRTLMMVLLVAVIGLGGLVAYSILKPPAVIEDPGPSKEELANRKQSAKLHARGKQKAQLKEWGSAIAFFRQAKSLYPTNFLIDGDLEAAKQERFVASRLKRAKRYIGENKFKEALEYVKIANKKMAAGSVYEDDAIRLENKAEAGIRNEAKKLQADIEKQNKEIARLKRRGRRGRRLAKAKLVQQKAQQAKLQELQQTVEKKKAPESGQDFFKKGLLDEAATAFQKAGDTGASKKLTEFKLNWRLARAAHRNRNVAEALRLLRKVQTLDLSLSGGGGRYTRRIRMMRANMYAARGQLAMANRNYSKAFRDFRKGIRVYNRHGISKSYLKQLKQIAAGKLKTAKKLKAAGNSDGASRNLRAVLSMVRKNTKLYTEARKLLGN